jgi:hypothetical protein
VEIVQKFERFLSPVKRFECIDFSIKDESSPEKMEERETTIESKLSEINKIIDKILYKDTKKPKIQVKSKKCENFNISKPNKRESKVKKSPKLTKRSLLKLTSPIENI